MMPSKGENPGLRKRKVLLTSMRRKGKWHTVWTAGLVLLFAMLVQWFKKTPSFRTICILINTFSSAYGSDIYIVLYAFSSAALDDNFYGRPRGSYTEEDDIIAADSDDDTTSRVEEVHS